MQAPSSPHAGLGSLTTAQWMVLADSLISTHPELARQFRFLDSLLPASQPDALRKKVQQFIGASKCPSATGCERLGARTRWIAAIVCGEVLSADLSVVLVQASLEKLLPACEGADDRAGLFRPAVRDLVQVCLQQVANLQTTPQSRVEILFHLAMADQCTLVEPLVWWNAIVRHDRAHALTLASHVIEQLAVIEPSTDRTWKTLGGRWTRLRLRSFLEHAGEKSLLADLLAKSALDDFEAAQAVALLRETGRGREALQLAERWNRLMPASPVLAWALVELYLEDGWDEEALRLAQWHFERDPNPRWLPLLQRAAGDAMTDKPFTHTASKDQQGSD